MANETAATGVAELDRALDGLYWGDNVVWVWEGGGGMLIASDFFGRCCPMLLDLGAIAYWSVPGASQYRSMHREIEQITQCIIVVGQGRIRISKAEGRPPGTQGQLFRYSVQDG